jgi:hypothetical protein
MLVDVGVFDSGGWSMDATELGVDTFGKTTTRHRLPEVLGEKAMYVGRLA